MIFRLIAVLLILAFGGCAKPPPAPIVILIGLDGFRWDYLEKFHPPTLLRLAREGVRAESMRPSFPTLTFPNFYTLATGLRPEHHGIVGNTMFDPVFSATFSLGSPAVKEGRWWGGEPLWVTAEKQGVRSACMFWPGSEAEIAGGRPSDWRPFQPSVTPGERVQTVLDWLARPPHERPRLITLYFHEADTAGHRKGLNGPEIAQAVKTLDDSLAHLLDGIRQLGLENVVNLIIVSDHGMTEVSPERAIVLSNLVDPAEAEVDFTGPNAGLRPLRGTAEELAAKIAARQEHFQTYLRENTPEPLHFRAHRRIPPVVLVGDEGWMFIRTPLDEMARANFPKAAHGFDPAYPSMGATFVASGPVFKAGRVIPPFENTEVYDLVCAILGLKPAPNDGTGLLAPEVLGK